MIPVRLQVRNFLCYRDNVPPLDFGGIHVACLSGANGHGKSALLDAMTWALWGKARARQDDHLIHQGQTDMEVTFDFLLDGHLYRVIRTRSKRGRGQSRLELQIEQEDGFRVLTESSMRTTQARIDRILRMDYETFINSAFLLQGRADEFTVKSPGDRKQVLADILGLGVYDRAEEIVKERARECEQSAAESNAQLREIDRELEHLSEYEAEEKKYFLESGRLAQQREEAQAKLQKAQDRVNELRLKERELQGVVRALEQDERALKSREAQRDTLVRRVAEFEAELGGATSVEAAQARADQIRQKHAEAEGTFGVLQNRLNELKVQERELEDLCRRHTQDEQALRKSETQRDSLLSRANELEALLGEAQTIEKAYQRLLDARASEAALGQKSLAAQELSRKVMELESAIAGTRQGIALELQQVQKQAAEQDAKCTQAEPLRAQLADVKVELAALSEKERERDGCRQKAQDIALEIERATAENRRLASESADLKMKAAQLSQASAHCPLCRSPLSEETRAGLLADMDSQMQDAREAAARNQERIRTLEGERKALTKRITALETALAARSPAERRDAALSQALAQAEAACQECDRLRADASEFERRLEQDDYADDERKRLGEAQEQLRVLKYDPKAHEQARAYVEELSQYEAQHARLQGAKKQLQAVQSDAERLDGDIQRWQKALEDSAARRAVLEESLADLSRIEAEYRARKARLDELAQEERKARDRAVRIAGALEQIETARVDIARLEDERAHLRQAVAASAKSKRSLEAELLALPELQSSRDTAQADLSALSDKERAARDHLAAARQKLEFCKSQVDAREKVQTALAETVKEKGVYEDLRLAFGKKGIQAMIIESVIPELQDEANALLGRMSDGKMGVELQTQRDTKSGNQMETLDIHISDELGPRPYELLSGGEAFRVNFAIRIALSKLLARRAGAQLHTLIIDEGFGSQDANGRQRLVDAIQSIQEDFEKILVITHVEELRDSFPVRIHVEKTAEGSTFTIM